MPSSSLWQAVLLSSISGLLVNAAPTPNADRSLREIMCGTLGSLPLGMKCPPVEALPTCVDSIKALNWANRKPSWMKADKPAGKPFCVSHWENGAKIVGLRAFKENSQDCQGKGAVSRLEVRFSDGSIVPVGSKATDCEAGSIGLNSDDEYWGDVIRSNVAGDTTDAQGKLRFQTFRPANLKLPDGKNLVVPVQERWLKDEYNPGAEDWNIGTSGGLMIGVVGYLDRDVITSLDFVFTPAVIERMEREDMQYDLDFLRKQVVSSNSIYLGTWTNQNGNHTDTFSISKLHTATRTTTTSWAQKYGSSGGMDFKTEVTLKIPVWKFVEGKAGVEGHWEVTQERTDSKDTTDTITDTITFTYTGNLDRGQTATCTATTGDVKITRAPFKSKTTIWYKGIAEPYTFREQGWLDGNIDLLQNNIVCSYRSATAADLSIKGVVVL